MEHPWKSIALWGFYVGKYSTMAIEIVHLFIKHGDFPYLFFSLPTGTLWWTNIAMENGHL